MIKRFLIAAAFSFWYLNLYPILIGAFVIYHYPYWSPPLAMAYVAGGLLVQAWFCFGRKDSGPHNGAMLQIGAGLLYAAAIVFAPGSTYMS